MGSGSFLEFSLSTLFLSSLIWIYLGLGREVRCFLDLISGLTSGTGFLYRLFLPSLQRNAYKATSGRKDLIVSQFEFTVLIGREGVVEGAGSSWSCDLCKQETG